ncbi:serine/threonine protein kinase [Pelatocladus sp. BLCC-F211]|uniref:serine/threonine protein kinase n=1 Tax=Pelatocladus sp. BLCC-F211 TaxID=3342752 RepID=UPI0035BAB076
MSSPSHSHPWIGRFVGDNQRYRLDQRLGGGGMGDVFLATDTRVGRQVALKLLKDTLVESTEMRKRFKREIAICAALPSEHIVKVSDCGVTPEGYPFYIMEYLQGETLGKLLRREQRLSVERTAKIISQVCNGLQLAHQGVNLPSGEHIQEVVHRDLKPDNIFLVSTDLGEWVKIVDFGIAKIRYEHTEQTSLTSTFLGTFRYAAPEQMMGDQNLDARADIYSLGVIIYEMLTGADPFGFSMQGHNMSEASWIVAHTSKPPKSLRSQPGCKQLSPEVEAVVMRCLEKEPARRFASVAELNEALQSATKRAVTGTGASIPETTIAQPRPLATQGSDLETLDRQLPTLPASQAEETISRPLQPPPVANPEATIIQPRPSSNSFAKEIREETIFQPRETKKTRKLPLSLLPIFGIIGLITIAIFGGIYTYFNLYLPRQSLNEIIILKKQLKYEDCIAKSKKVAPHEKIYEKVQEILNECRLAYANKLEKEEKSQEACSIAQEIPIDSPLYSEAQKFCEI